VTLAKVRVPQPRMNKTEALFSVTALHGRSHGFEEITLRLGDDCRYTPDFWAIGADEVLEFHEVKGFWRDDAKVKIRVAAEKFPQFRFFAWRHIKGTWQRETFGPEDQAA
jgi:hypothetical protein